MCKNDFSLQEGFVKFKHIPVTKEPYHLPDYLSRDFAPQDFDKRFGGFLNK
jgi:hypothetical protein